MQRAITLIVTLLLLLTAGPARAQLSSRLVPAGVQHTCLTISSATTTTLASPTGSGVVEVWQLHAEVDVTGARTTLTFQDSGGTNLEGPSVTRVVEPGTDRRWPARGVPYMTTSAGTSLQVVTSAGGPVKVCVWYTR